MPAGPSLSQSKAEKKRGLRSSRERLAKQSERQRPLKAGARSQKMAKSKGSSRKTKPGESESKKQQNKASRMTTSGKSAKTERKSQHSAVKEQIVHHKEPNVFHPPPAPSAVKVSLRSESSPLPSPLPPAKQKKSSSASVLKPKVTNKNERPPSSRPTDQQEKSHTAADSSQSPKSTPKEREPVGVEQLGKVESAPAVDKSPTVEDISGADHQDPPDSDAEPPAKETSVLRKLVPGFSFGMGAQRFIVVSGHIEDGEYGHCIVQEQGREEYINFSIETVDSKVKRIDNECVILVRAMAANLQCFPKVITRGMDEEYQIKYLGVERLGKTIDDLRSFHYKGGEFSTRTAFLLTVQSFEALAHVHRFGFVHRDVRPGSFCLHPTRRPFQLLLTNLGLARRWRCLRRKIALPPRACGVPCFGDRRYVSRTAHERQERYTSDDVEAWLFMSLEFFDSAFLPWSDSMSLTTIEVKKKAFIEQGGIVERMGEGERKNVECLRILSQILDHLQPPKSTREPDRKKIRLVLEELRKHLELPAHTDFSWEDSQVVNGPMAKTTARMSTESDRRKNAGSDGISRS